MARSQGFLDPIALLSRLHRFAQPSEVAEPIELLRAGVVFHARGLINARAIQHNLDWVWPFWVERQFDPRSVSFVPRAFSITHINLTHRNWTAVGLPGVDWLPIVDPRGLVTPMYDGWSVDAWLILDDGRRILPSRLDDAKQQLRLGQDEHRDTKEPKEPGGPGGPGDTDAVEPGVSVETRVAGDGGHIRSVVDVVLDGGQPTCRMCFAAQVDAPGWLVLSLRPANPEGVSFIHELEVHDQGQRMVINDEHELRLDTVPRHVRMSEYRKGDVLLEVEEPAHAQAAALRCDIGLATAAAMFRIEPGEPVEVTARAPMTREQEPSKPHPHPAKVGETWREALDDACELQIPDTWMKFLYDAAIRNLILHAPDEVYPGPYTYKRFWFRDAAFILNALLAAGRFDRVARCIDGFAARQTGAGYFLSQEGEWDSNGAALWIMERYRKLSGRTIPRGWLDSAGTGARWIKDKRMSEDLDKPHAGLLPAGFSAEHLGPNDYYYWDDFWSVAGLLSAADMIEAHGDAQAARRARDEAASLMTSIDRSLEVSRDIRGHDGIPASPYRRMDAGAIGSVCAGYPLQLWAPDDPRLLATTEFLINHCTVRGGFFQDMIHSGINAYLTLHLAQVMMRAGETRRAFELIEATASLASPTGQWPEAIHPHTLGGCMGDGQHLWAAADWVMTMRHLFVREEDDRLIVGQGLPEAWLNGEPATAKAQGSPSPGFSGSAPMRLGPTPTPWGPVTIEVTPGDAGIEVAWHGRWRGEPPTIDIRLIGCEPRVVPGDAPQPVMIPRATCEAAQRRDPAASGVEAGMETGA